MPQPTSPKKRRLSRLDVLDQAIRMADSGGVEAVNMRALSEALGVVPMALYKHVVNKEALLDGMVEQIITEIEPCTGGPDWKAAVRRRVLAARTVLTRHLWASRVIESRTSASPAALAYMDSLMGLFRAGGLSVDLTHHAMHALGSRMWGFTQEVFPTSDPKAPLDDLAQEAMLTAAASTYPHIVEIARAARHEPGPGVGAGCDDQFEFEFALDLILDGIERLHRAGWSSALGRTGSMEPVP